MPRASNGTYTLPPGTIVSTGDTILPSQHNPAMLDIASVLTDSMPKTGGTFTGQVSFPAGVGGNIAVYGTFSVSGSAGMNGPLTVGGNLGVGGVATFNGNVNVGGTMTAPSLALSSFITVGGSMAVTGYAIFSAGLGTTGAISVNGQQVVGARQSGVANATNSTDVVTQFNLLLNGLRAHGLIG